MAEIAHYLQISDMTGLGFCDSTICGFYRKCGYQVVNTLSARMRYQYAERDGIPDQLDGPRGCLYQECSDRIISTLLADNNPVYIDVPFW